MASADIRDVDIIVNEATTDKEAAALRRLFQEAGVNADVDASYAQDQQEGPAWMGSRRGAFERGHAGQYEVPESSRWTVLIYTDTRRFAGELGARKLKALVERVRALRAEHNDTSPVDGTIMLVDEETGIRILAEHQLPDRAYDLLADLDMTAFHSDPLHFDRTAGPSGHWRSPAGTSGTG